MGMKRLKIQLSGQIGQEERQGWLSGGQSIGDGRTGAPALGSRSVSIWA